MILFIVLELRVNDAFLVVALIAIQANKHSSSFTKLEKAHNLFGELTAVHN